MTSNVPYDRLFSSSAGLRRRKGSIMNSVQNVEQSPVGVISSGQSGDGPPAQTTGDFYPSGIYGICCTKNNKWYIGKSINIRNRWASHLWRLKNQKHNNEYLQRAWNKYGQASFSFQVLTTAEAAQLPELEKHFIAEYRALAPDGFNLTTGGETNIQFSESSLKKLSLARIGKTWTEIAKRKLAKKRKGAGNPMFGVKQSDATKLARIEAIKKTRATRAAELAEAIGTENKVCGHCKKILNKSQFKSNPRSPSGLSCWCKACRNEEQNRRRANKRKENNNNDKVIAE